MDVLSRAIGLLARCPGVERPLPCPLCGGAHPADAPICPVTGKSVPRGASGLPKLKSFAMETLDDEDTRRGNPKPASVRPPKSSGPAALIGEVIAGKYKLNAVLGAGGMGTVYDGEHVQLGRPVAVKVLIRTPTTSGANAEKRFLKEARSAGSLAHPNICQVFDFGTTPNGASYLVMEKLTGETLGQRLSRTRKLPIAEAVSITLQLLDGLGAAHEQNILHRDVKPENVFLATLPGSGEMVPGPTVKILDFGIAKNMASHGGTLDTLTQHGMVMGTPHYMSPEQARGKRDLDARVDLYACGVILYEMLAGVRPFEAPMANDILLQIVRNAPTGVSAHRPDVPPELERVVLRAMRKERNDRFAAAADFVAELRAIRLDQRPRVPEPSSSTNVVNPYPPRKDAVTVHRGKTPPQQPQQEELPSRVDLTDLDVMRTIEDPNPPSDED